MIEHSSSERTDERANEERVRRRSEEQGKREPGKPDSERQSARREQARSAHRIGEERRKRRRGESEGQSAGHALGGPRREGGRDSDSRQSQLNLKLALARSPRHCGLSTGIRTGQQRRVLVRVLVRVHACLLGLGSPCSLRGPEPELELERSPGESATRAASAPPAPLHVLPASPIRVRPGLRAGGSGPGRPRASRAPAHGSRPGPAQGPVRVHCATRRAVVP
jgi:hypothetical protein